MTKGDIKELLDSEEFYVLMQEYRHTPINDQARVTECFEKVKAFILYAIWLIEC